MRGGVGGRGSGRTGFPSRDYEASARAGSESVFRRKLARFSGWVAVVKRTPPPVSRGERGLANGEAVPPFVPSRHYARGRNWPSDGSAAHRPRYSSQITSNCTRAGGLLVVVLEVLGIELEEPVQDREVAFDVSVVKSETELAGGFVHSGHGVVEVVLSLDALDDALGVSWLVAGRICS